MSTTPTPVESNDMDDLDTFSESFFGQKETPKEPASSEEKDEDVVKDSDAPKDTQDGEDDTPAPDGDEVDEPDEGEDEEEIPEPKPAKKSRAQERIEELNAKYRETERQLNELRAKLEQKTEPTPVPVKVEVDTGPTPDDKNEDGSDKYALGEFDPQYIRDLTRHTLQVEREAMKAQEAQEDVTRQMTQQRAALQASWEDKLGPAQERYPDFREKGETLISQFDGIDQGYGEYLTSTIQSMEFGPDVLYYLSNNPDEAKTIVASGPAKATIALGRIEAKFAMANEEKQRARPKVSNAPVPPPHVNKGSSAAVKDVADDTDDLDLFEKKFFNGKKRRG